MHHTIKNVKNDKESVNLYISLSTNGLQLVQTKHAFNLSAGLS